MPEIRFTIPDKLNDRILTVAESLGVDKSEYIKSLILTDIRDKGDPSKGQERGSR